MKLSKMANYEDPNSFGSRMRARRLAPLVDLIRKVHAEKGSVRILDVGGRETYWKALDEGFLKDHNVTVTIMNLPCELSGEDGPIFKHKAGDACAMPEYGDNSFDIVHSNSVIEHVGGWSKVKEFAKEVRRVAPNLFVQTPSYWFPIEPHFIKPFHHWLPKPVRVWIWRHFEMGQRKKAANIDEAMESFDEEPYLLTKEMYEFLFPDCRILKERFMLLTKSMVAYRSK